MTQDSAFNPEDSARGQRLVAPQRGQLGAVSRLMPGSSVGDANKTDSAGALAIQRG